VISHSVVDWPHQNGGALFDSLGGRGGTSVPFIPVFLTLFIIPIHPPILNNAHLPRQKTPHRPQSPTSSLLPLQTELCNKKNKNVDNRKKLSRNLTTSSEE
jgi:hypothetical protein